MEWIALGAVALASLWVGWRMLPMWRLIAEPMGRRERRLVFRRGVRAMAVWQCSIAAFLMAHGSFANAAPLLCLGVFFLAASRWPALIGVD